MLKRTAQNGKTLQLVQIAAATNCSEMQVVETSLYAHCAPQLVAIGQGPEVDESLMRVLMAPASKLAVGEICRRDRLGGSSTSTIEPPHEARHQ